MIALINSIGKPLRFIAHKIALCGIDPNALVKSSVVITIDLLLRFDSAINSLIVEICSEIPFKPALKPFWTGLMKLHSELKPCNTLVIWHIIIRYNVVEIEIGLHDLISFGSPFL